MKAAILLAFAGLALLSVICHASENVEQDSFEEVFSAIFAMEDDLKPKERVCRGYGLPCTPEKNDCCQRLYCSQHRLCSVKAGK
uniref:U15-theraphotoxin-Cg1a n=1 Tax=Chilobrachys guangxiensis TaxID=278060 RepID=JZT24_CHIGU|nr:RecName: Full=U15-theraphotoxin-Cg1a; Short=U15-TRTX-Cg1a; AltName: Full=Jingzhaotoxin-24; Short=JZTX-24; AltName: Full=Peptide F5-8.99; Flags: Precursor [Chilobrachys guangxiensis]ABY71700.1 cystine knot toxin [Chilobrachys guangxiensis]